ncbi:uncharacterized protein TrAFT101_005548 [Trichoderma asperellum]|uniref:uncharacterized protein n=1 Tax=Trichoderma asperellum TaxID=101201 RepID=UPI00333353B5|nr:hypothetical protein TrAFT101_005548 [Trichoderma asperellum]
MLLATPSFFRTEQQFCAIGLSSPLRCNGSGEPKGVRRRAHRSIPGFSLTALVTADAKRATESVYSTANGVHAINKRQV